MANPDGLERLVDDGVIDAVHTRLMSGKEAAVYVVERRGEIIAAKVYKARNERTFKKVASYVEGRNQTRSSRDRRAMEKKTSYGRDLLEEGWRDMEFRALREAYDAGVRVPEPLLLYEDVLLMELLVDEQGQPAPRLADFELTPEVATLLHLEVFLEVKKLLAIGKVHGDLSAYNILITHEGPTIIDMPQVVDVSGNTSACEILRRDLRNVTEHLARFDARLLRFADCGEALFQHYQRGTLERATGPEEAAPVSRTGGRRARDAERGRAGRGPSQRAGQAHVDVAAPQPDRPRHDGPRHDGPRHDGPRHDGPRHDGPRHEAPRHHNGPRHDGPRHPGPRNDGPRPEAPRHNNGPRPDGPPRNHGPRQDAPRPHERQEQRPHDARHEPRHDDRGRRGPPQGPQNQQPRDQRDNRPRNPGQGPRNHQGPGPIIERTEVTRPAVSRANVSRAGGAGTR
jgi:RIO kinase 1